MRRLVLVLTLGVLGVAGCGGDDEPEDGSARRSGTADETTRENADSAAVVEMNDQLAFEPKQIEATAGEEVTWRNAGKVAHTVTADKSKVADPSLVTVPAGTMEWDSGFVGEGESFSRSFERPGTYRYVCIPHEGAGMVGSVVVG